MEPDFSSIRIQEVCQSGIAAIAIITHTRDAEPERDRLHHNRIAQQALARRPLETPGLKPKLF
jgi:hypothetical protein